MDISKILLVCILSILLILTLNYCFEHEFLTNDLPDNNIVASGNENILIPTSDQIYNPNDTNRPDNNLSHQETNILTNNEDTDLVNTGIDIPLVYTNDEIEDTTIKHIFHPPSYVSNVIDTGSGDINNVNEINNNILDNLKSIE